MDTTDVPAGVSSLGSIDSTQFMPASNERATPFLPPGENGSQELTAGSDWSAKADACATIDYRRGVSPRGTVQPGVRGTKRDPLIELRRSKSRWYRAEPQRRDRRVDRVGDDPTDDHPAGDEFHRGGPSALCASDTGCIE